MIVYYDKQVIWNRLPIIILPLHHLMDISKTTVPNTPSAFRDRKRKNTTFVSSPSRSILRFDNMEQGLEMLKISLKKQSDRRSKLRKLLEKYTQICAQEKKHVKQIKSSIIEMKDSNATCKLKLLVDPTILVENSIKVETRQFLCALMNTFYRTYGENKSNSQTIVNLNNTMAFLIKGISYTEDMIFMMQKSQINEQIQLESQVIAQKNRLKEETLKTRSTREEYNAVLAVYSLQKHQNAKKKEDLQQLRSKLACLTEQSETLGRRIKQQEDFRAECQDQIDIELLYHQKLGSELGMFGQQVQSNKKQSKTMLRKLLAGKVRQQELKNNRPKQANKSRRLGEQAKQKLKFQLQVQFQHLRG